MARAVAAWLSVFAASAGLYLLLAGSLSRDELIACLPVAGALTALVAARRRAHTRVLALPRPPLRALLRPLVAVMGDTVRVGRVLLRALGPRVPAGRITSQGFRQGLRTTPPRPEDAGRRALVVLGSSLAPNGYVLGQSGQALRLHRLADAAGQDDTEWPT